MAEVNCKFPQRLLVKDREAVQGLLPGEVWCMGTGAGIG